METPTRHDVGVSAGDLTLTGRRRVMEELWYGIVESRLYRDCTGIITCTVWGNTPSYTYSSAIVLLDWIRFVLARVPDGTHTKLTRYLHSLTLRHSRTDVANDRRGGARVTGSSQQVQPRILRREE